ncbi:PorP/SprF family type IX secretion system membrane protein [Saccharicrinis aurantiacus]|uniref:PorP/SprF family type IX secretion system membrane protein n=1 Tax=Saccharicrinis aurantiacus TaxID=1849719 RepID=UPI0009FB7572|nr:type IX secretion system membrane protein PorP/SprF [Saccharicrinis aurantiacus]
MIKIIKSNFINYTIGCILLLVCSSNCFAQREIIMSQYMYNKYSINPAFAGSHESLSLFASYRKQWLGFDHSASGGIATIHSPLKNETMALGAQVYSEKVGVTNNTGFNISYAYRTNISNTTKLSFALSAGFYNQNNNWSDVTIIDPEDPLFGYAEQLSAPWLGFGTAVYNNNYFIGLSIPSLVYSDNYETGENKLDFGKIDYLFTGGYFFHINSNFTLNPATLVRVNPNTTSFIDFSTTAIINNALICGVSYRTTNEIVGILGYQISPQTRITYSLDYTLEKLSNYNNGTHEIALQFNFGYKINTPNPKFF